VFHSPLLLLLLPLSKAGRRLRHRHRNDVAEGKGGEAKVIIFYRFGY